MKKVLVIIALLSLPLVAISQNEAPSTTKTITTISSDNIKVKAVKARKVLPKRNAKALQLNYKKSNDIISIKAYRKSLHVRVRTKKLC